MTFRTTSAAEFSRSAAGLTVSLIYDLVWRIYRSWARFPPARVLPRAIAYVLK